MQKNLTYLKMLLPAVLLMLASCDDQEAASVTNIEGRDDLFYTQWVALEKAIDSLRAQAEAEGKIFVEYPAMTIPRSDTLTIKIISE